MLLIYWKLRKMNIITDSDFIFIQLSVEEVALNGKLIILDGNRVTQYNSPPPTSYYRITGPGLYLVVFSAKDNTGSIRQLIVTGDETVTEDAFVQILRNLYDTNLVSYEQLQILFNNYFNIPEA